MGSLDMPPILRKLARSLALGGPLVAMLACRGEEITTPTDQPAIPAGEIEMATAGASRIAFIVRFSSRVDDRSDIFTMIPDGTGVRQLTHGLFFEDHMDWAPGNAKLVAQAAGDIYVVNADGSGTKNLTNTSNADESDGMWSPDGRKIVYTRGSDIWVMNSNGTGQRNLTRSTASDDQPGWSPDGRKIVFLSGQVGIGQPGVATVHVMNADGSGKRSLTTNNTAQSDDDPRWSPDGRQIAFVRGYNEIWVMNSDGSRQINVTNHPAGDGVPRWSPNSARIVFSSNRKGNPDVYVMGRYGGSKINLTQSPAEEIPRGWSPGGARILYQIGSQIWVMNADGTNKKRIYQGGMDAVWSR
jgi:TolB protein